MISTHTLRKMCAAVSTVLLASLSVPASLAEQEEATSETSTNSSSSATSDSKAVLVMDLSDSMMTKDAGGGGTRLDAAKKAATGLIDALPDSANMGMVVYGQQESNAPNNRAAGCKDVETISPVGPINKGELKDRISNFKAKGYTPIGNSLLKAAEELGKEGERSIVLVSDGHDTCAPPPVCEVAKKLAGEGYNLTIHTVGFHADRKARKELECIAKTSGGQYLSAENASELSNSMKFLATRSMVGYQAVGTPFEFAKRPEDAKYLGEGRYRTKIKPEINPSDPTPLYYKLAIPKNHNAIVTLKAIPRKSSNGEGHHDLYYDIEDVKNSSSDKCQDFDPFLNGGVRAHADTYEAVKAAGGIVTVDPEEGQSPECDQNQWVVENEVQISTHEVKDEYRDEEVDVEVEVHFEPQVMKNDRKKFPEGSTGSSAPQDSLKEDHFPNPEEVQGAPNYASAPELQSGKAYKDGVVRGEMKYYKIPVAWGQQPVVTVRGTKGQTGKIVEPSLIMTNPFYSDTAGTTKTKKLDEGGVISPDRPIQYNNRDANAGGIDHAYAGYYYVGVGVSESFGESLKGSEQPYEISVKLEGEPSEGPDWRPSQANGPAPSDQPILAEGTGAANDEQGSSSAKADEEKSDANATNTAKSSDSETPPWLIPAGAVAIIALIIGIVLGIKSRRPRG
ncbi:putative secreted protein [Corynebacterium resistens DSM 45100]|uniref:Secreted protein n=1 Tax=Corynebacterium resistens (strain DSM 45100 / JCM 12819 / GTC 2026 / SICGH 158) TaxID=662755 RepID=F8E395_CORRG|nr:VWA domain-containing protein [Corynebacterium resistens]AEI10421.1 putative secreted protein [Corynebacterium resistens DSM 45100]